MTTKDYKKIAEVFKARVDNLMRNDPERCIDAPDKAYWTGQRHSAEMLAIHMADMLQTDNPHFKKETFFKACGLSATGTI